MKSPSPDYSDENDTSREEIEDRAVKSRVSSMVVVVEQNAGKRKERTPLSEDENREKRKRSASRSPERRIAQKNNLDNKENKRKNNPLLMKTGGAYIPPARLKQMQASITDKSSEEYQRISWEALKKSINGLVNKVNVSNLPAIVTELLQENIVRGRGLLVRALIQAQTASPSFTHVYAAVIAVINTKFPQIGELVLKRLILSFRRSFRLNAKNTCFTTSKMLAHLVNQQVAHEIVALQLICLLLNKPTSDSIEVTIELLKQCGQRLTELSPLGVNGIYDTLRSILHSGKVEARVQYMIEVMFAVRKDKYKDHPAIPEELDLVPEDDQFTHMIQLDDQITPDTHLNIFKFDPDYLENEDKYKELKAEILGEIVFPERGDDEDSEEEESEEEEDKEMVIRDETQTNLVALRRAIYLTIQSSLDFEECAHKMLKLQIKPGQEVEMCLMILDCCAQLRSYEKFYGLLAARFCALDQKYVEPFETAFKEQYETIHRLETLKLRNVTKFLAHLLHADAISWGVLQCIKLTEDDTTSSGRIFIKILFQELAEHLGLVKLNERFHDPTMQEYFENLLPHDSPQNTRFAINFFTSIGLGGLTDELRVHLKTVNKKASEKKQDELKNLVKQLQEESSDDDDSSDSDSSSSSSSSDDSSDSDSDDTEVVKKIAIKQEVKTPEPESPRNDSHRRRNRSRYDDYNRRRSLSPKSNSRSNRSRKNEEKRRSPIADSRSARKKSRHDENRRVHRS